MTVDEEKEVTIEKAYDNYREFGVAYEQPKPVKRTPVVEEEPEIELPKELEEIISNTPVEEEEEKEPLVRDSSKVDEEEAVMEPLEDPVLEEEEEKEEKVVPTREEKKKDTKVDDDFFELIDSMYKERIDE